MIYGTACLIHKGTQILLELRLGGLTDIHEGHWVFPGGKTKPGEAGLACVVRETGEETGLTIKNPQLRATVHFDNKGRILNSKLNPEDWTVEMYETSDFEGELKAESPKLVLRWVDESELPNYKMHEGDRRLLQLFKTPGAYRVRTRYDKETLTEFEVSELK